MPPPMRSNKQSYTGGRNPSDLDAMNNLWVGNLAPDVSDSDLRSLFSKHGVVESITSYPSRSYAFLYFRRGDEAMDAKYALQGIVLKGSPLKIEFAKPDQVLDIHEKDGKVDYHDPLRVLQTYRVNHSGLALPGLKRPQPIQSFGSLNGDEESNVLQISYPPSAHIDENMLHNAMILFGEIDSINSFPLRHCSFVQFRSVEEARRAKEGLQGHLFGDPRILIMFSSNEPPHHVPEIRGPGSDLLFNDIHFLPGQINVLNHNRPIGSNNLHGHLAPHVVGGGEVSVRPYAPTRPHEPLLARLELRDLASLHKLQDPNSMPLMNGPNWRSSPVAGILASPSAGMNVPLRLPSSLPAGMNVPSRPPMPSQWDALDGSQLQREPKRSRIDVALSAKELNERMLSSDSANGVGRKVDEGSLVSVGNIPRLNQLSPVNSQFRSVGLGVEQTDIDYIWRGVIAKGGSPVCRARAVPVGDWSGFDIPQVVNYSARTGLDLLATHCACAIGFNIIFFLPDSEEDFASYTEFLRYLGDKNRAGVAKFDDGTTLFLVPPSDFLKNVLHVSGPERLYGVILMSSEEAPSNIPLLPQQSQPPLLVDKWQVPPRNESNIISQEERMLQHQNYYKALGDKSELIVPVTTKPFPTSYIPQAITGANTTAATVITPGISHGGLSLSPELIATLTSLFLAKEKPSNSEQSPGIMDLKYMSTATSDRAHLQGLDYESCVPEQAGLVLQQGVGLHNHQPQIQPVHPSISNIATTFFGSTNTQGLQFNLPQKGTVPLHPSHPYQPEIANEAQDRDGIEQRMDVYGQFTSSVLEPSHSGVALSHNVYQQQSVVPNAQLDIPDRLQQLQSALQQGAGQNSSEIDADKNERYRSTLEFAANLLRQIQRQQPDAAARQGVGNPQ